MYVQIYMHVHTYFDKKSHCAHYLLFLIHIIENNNECNSKTKGNAFKHIAINYLCNIAIN